MIMLKYILIPFRLQGPCLKGFPWSVLQNSALTKKWQRSSTQEVNKFLGKAAKLGKHNSDLKNLKLDNLKNSEKARNQQILQHCPLIAGGNFSHKWCSILPWKKATKNAFGTGFLNICPNHFMHLCPCQSYGCFDSSSLQILYNLHIHWRKLPWWCFLLVNICCER